MLHNSSSSSSSSDLLWRWQSMVDIDQGSEPLGRISLRASWKSGPSLAKMIIMNYSVLPVKMKINVLHNAMLI